MESLEIGLCWGTVYKAGLIEVFSDELAAMSIDAAAERTARAIAKWRSEIGI